MIRVSANHLNGLATILPAYNFIVVGELHGSTQNAPIIHNLLALILTATGRAGIAFEWPISQKDQTALQAYVNGGPVPVALPPFFLNSDGRFTRQHANLLVWLRRSHRLGDAIDIHFFDEDNNTGDPEERLAHTLEQIHQREPATPLLVETGNFHARKQSDRRQLPMAARLTADYKVFTIFLRYLSGLIDVAGQHRDVTQAASQKQNPNKYFDAIIEIAQSEPAEQLTDLTTIRDLLCLN